MVFKINCSKKPTENYINEKHINVLWKQGW